MTLAYLAIQIRQNTRAMQEARRLALAQTYQMRADALQRKVGEATSALQEELAERQKTELELLGHVDLYVSRHHEGFAVTVQLQALL